MKILHPLDGLIDRLPQKAPFLFIDHVLEIVPQKSVLGTKLFPAGDPIFENHLPGEPLVPGVIVIEALAQLAGLALLGSDGAPLRGYLGEVTRMRFHRLVHPGEELLLSAELEQAFGAFARFRVKAEVKGAALDELAAEGSIVVARKPGG